MIWFDLNMFNCIYTHTKVLNTMNVNYDDISSKYVNTLCKYPDIQKKN